MSSKGAWVTSAIGLSSVGVGLIVGAPYMIGCGAAGAIVAGVGAVTEDIRIGRDRKMLKACDIYIKRGDVYYYPSIISKTDRHMLLDLPWGMGIKDIISKHSHIEAYYGNKVLIEQTSNRKVLIKLLDPVNDEQDKWIDIFTQIGVLGPVGAYPKLVNCETNKIGQKIIFSLPSGLIVKDFDGSKSNIESILKCKIAIAEENYNLAIQTMTREFKKLYKIDFKEKILPDMEFIIGVGRDGEPLAVDLGGNEFSTLVCGASGSGKSVFLNCLMTQFILKNVEIRAIDLKAVEFKIFKQYRNMSKYATSRHDAIPVLENTYDLMQERYKILEESSCKSYSDYNKRFGNKMPPVLLIIDEFSVLMNGEKNKSNLFLFELLSRARAANILVVICTQTPRAKILDTTIRCNIKNTVCFSVETDADSEVALGQKGNYRAARELNDPGRGFLKNRGKLIEFQSYFLEDSEIEMQIAGKMSRNTTPLKSTQEKGQSNKVIPLQQPDQMPIQNKEEEADINSLLSKIDDLQ